MLKTQRMAQGLVAGALVATLLATGGAAKAKGPTTTVQKYGWHDASEYDAKWAAGFGPGEGTRSVMSNAVTVNAVPFTTGADFSVFDHLKYIRTSTQSFDVPTIGSVEVSVDIEAETPGTEAGRIVHGCYGPPGWQIGDFCAQPFAQVAREGQQAGVVLNVINFQTGQLFDWFVSGGQVFALIERLPSTVTGGTGVGPDLMYTQIIKEAPVKGRKHNVSIRYSRGPGKSTVEYFLDHKLFATIDQVGIPLDKRNPPVPFTGYAPSLGNGAQVSLDSVVIGHGLFSLLDAFPYQHPGVPLLSVSVPLSERLFGQGAIGTWKDFEVRTTTG